MRRSNGFVAAMVIRSRRRLNPTLIAPPTPETSTRHAMVARRIFEPRRRPELLRRPTTASPCRTSRRRQAESRATSSSRIHMEVLTEVCG
mmetsp:Transcript_44682/g.69672  ORF Transcript_44682/g.69672 Transcript_44682/m.69672 type:complete len:90 (+) Transcript_44682:226-495(+)